MSDAVNFLLSTGTPAVPLDTTGGTLIKNTELLVNTRPVESHGRSRETILARPLSHTYSN